VRLRYVILVAAGVTLGLLGVVALREATLSTHHHVPRATQATVVLQATTKGGEPGQTLDEMVEAILLTCRLEVGRSDLVDRRDDGEGRYVAVFEPGMDETNARQLRGCLEDWAVDHVRIDVVELIPH
jgi:hypothetical protein